MIVVCAGMYRACSTWQYDVAAHLVERHRRGLRLGYMDPRAFAAWLPALPQSGRDWWVIKAHEGSPLLCRALATGQALALGAHRDLRDVVFSMLRKRQQSFDTFVREGMVHQILVNDRFWSGRPGVVSQRYEDVVTDPERAVAELAGHLGIGLGPGETARVAAEYSFEATRRRLQGLAEQLASRGFDLKDPENAQLYDATTLLHWNHLNEGKVGGWRDCASRAERAVLRRLCGRWLAEHGYPADADAPAWGQLSRAERRHWRAALVRGWIACASRSASIRHPRLSRVAKRSLGMAEPELARPIGGATFDLSAPHWASRTGPLVGAEARTESRLA